MNFTILCSFISFLAIFALIGLSSVIHSKNTKKDYYLASSSMPAWLVGLSAVATNNSGYMFIGVIGYTYTTGLASIWLMVGWIMGDFLASLYVHKQLRIATEETGESSYAGALANWHKNSPHIQKIFGLITLFFLLSYASAQFLAGSKALYALFGWPHWAGAVIGACIVVAYCYAGGIRASIWTDAAQSIVMIIAMGILLTSAVTHLGGIQPTIEAMRQVDGFLNWFPKDLALPGLAGGLLFIIGWLAAGFGVAGQPHIMVRFMTLKNTSDITQSRLWYYSWFTLFYAAATGVGMLSRIYLTDTANFDAELALPTMALQILHPVLAGVILAGIFAATMSTADSLILSCSAAISHDLFSDKIKKQWMVKLSTVLTTAAALLFTLINKDTVFNLVILSWSALASSFCPLLIVYALGGKPKAGGIFLLSSVGLAASLLWRQAGLHSMVYEGLPAILISLTAYGLLCLIQKKGTA